MSSSSQSNQSQRKNRSLARRAITASTAAVLAFTTVPALTSGHISSAFGTTQTVFGTNVTYDDQDPSSVPWATTVKANVTRFGGLHLSLDAVERAGIAKTGNYDQWGSPVPLTIWDPANPTPYRRNFTSLDRPIPFSASNTLRSQLGEWTYVSQSSSFTVTWNPAPGYIGYAPPLPIQIDPARIEGQPSPKFHYATVGLPGKKTKQLTSTGTLGVQQGAQARLGFDGITDGIIWDLSPTFAFQVDRNDQIATIVPGIDYQNDYDGNYVGYVTTELNTPEGRYAINPDSGEITFTPAADFFTDAELDNPTITQKTATPIRVIVSNMLTNLDEGNGRVIAYGETRPAHTIDSNNQSYSEVSTTYTPTVVKPKVGLQPAVANELAGNVATLRPDFSQASGQSAINKATVSLVNSSGEIVGKELKVAGEGTWRAANDGTITFTPEFGFIGDPTPIRYTAKNDAGISAGKAYLRVVYALRTAGVASTVGEQNATQYSDGKAGDDLGLSPQEMFPGYPSDWYANFKYALVGAGGQLVQSLDAEKAGKKIGTYTIDKNGRVTFTPEPSFTGAAPTASIRITNLTTANGQAMPNDGKYRPIVQPAAVVLQPAINTGEVGTAISATPNYAPQDFSKIDPATIAIVGASGDKKKLAVAGQGTWEVDSTGTFTFTPLPGFIGDPSPIQYTASNVNGIPALEPAAVAVTYSPIMTSKATTIGGPTETQKSTDLNSPGDHGKTTEQLFPGLPAAWIGSAITFELVDQDGKSGTALTVPGEGDYTIDKASGVVSFTPINGFLGGQNLRIASGVKIRALGVSSNGAVKSNSLIAEYIPAVELRDTTLPSATRSADGIGMPVSVTPSYGSYSTDPTTVKLVGASGDGKTLKVDGQGTWTVNPTTGEFTFTPQAGFNGSPAPVEYTANATNGNAAIGTGQVALFYPSVTTKSATTIGDQGAQQLSTDKDGNSQGLSTSEMFSGLPSTWYGSATSPVQFQLLDNAGKPVADNRLDLDGVGSYVLNASTGTVTFIGDKSFTGQAPQVQIQTVGLKNEKGQPNELTATYQPYVVPIRVEVPSAYANADTIGSPVTITPDYTADATVDLNTIRITGSDPNGDGKTLVVPNEGVWTVDDKGVFTFTPNGSDAAGGALIGSPSPIFYSAKNGQGIPAKVPGQISAFYPTPDPIEAITTAPQGVTQYSDDKGAQDQGLTISEMYPNIARASWWPKASFTLYDAAGAETDSVTFDGQGTYTIDSTTGRITFVPAAEFFGTAAPVQIGIKNVQTHPKSKYTAVVTKVEVTLLEASASGKIGESLVATPTMPGSVDKSSIAIQGANPGDPKTKTVPGEGKWSVDGEGKFTFVPADGFIGQPTPLHFTFVDPVTDQPVPGVITGSYLPVEVSAQESRGDHDANQTSSDGTKLFPGLVVPGWTSPTYSLRGADADGKLVVDGQGSYSIDPTTGVVTFDPLPTFAGTASAATVVAKTATGQTVTTTYTPTVERDASVPLLPSAERVLLTLGSKAELTPNYPADVDETTIRIVDADPNSGGKQKTVPGQGVWSVNDNGTFSFDPLPGFLGDPTPITYLGKSVAGVEAKTPGTITLDYSEPRVVPATSVGTQSEVQSSHPLKELFPDIPANVVPSFTLDGASSDGKLVRPAEGSYEIADDKVKFTPEAGYIGTPEPVTVVLTTQNGDKLQTTYTPTVSELAVPLPSGHHIATQLGQPVSVTPIYPESIDKASIKIITVPGAVLSADGKTLTVPGEGSWTVDQAGNFTFTPNGLTNDRGAFVGDPTPISYTAKNISGVQATVPGQISAAYPQPITRDAISTGEQGQVQSSADNGSQDQGRTAAEMFPSFVGANWWQSAQFTLLDDAGAPVTEYKVDGQGVYRIDSSTGVVTFTPDADFSGTANPARVSIKDVQGSPSAKYTAVVTKTAQIPQPEVQQLPESTATGLQPGQIAQVTPSYPSDVDTGSIRFDGATSTDGKTKQVTDQGTWTVDDEGTFTFKPADGFAGKPVEVSYTAKSKDGGSTSFVGKVVVEYQPGTNPGGTTTPGGNEGTTSPGGSQDTTTPPSLTQPQPGDSATAQPSVPGLPKNPDGSLTVPSGSTVIVPAGVTIKPGTTVVVPDGTVVKVPNGERIDVPGGTKLNIPADAKVISLRKDGVKGVSLPNTGADGLTGLLGAAAFMTLLGVGFATRRRNRD